jgi:GAF domain-containing protein
LIPDPDLDLDPSLNVAEAAREMAEGSTLTETVERAVQMTVDVIDHCDMAGVSVATSSRVRTLAASSDLLRIIDDLQFQLREGPCFDTLRSQDAVTANDLATDPRWPQWGPLVSDRTGARASMSFRLFTNRDGLGALNVYSTQSAGFSGDDAVLGYVVAAHTAVAIANLREVQQLTSALENRTTIGQATGIIMERFGLDADSAFGVLRRISQTNNIKVATLAADLVAQGRIPDIGS